MNDFSWNLPNVLSLLRIACLPVAVAAVLLHNKPAFVGIFIFAQITDILDGYLARRLHLQTDAGALLDSYGDVGSYIMAATGLVCFQRAFLTTYWPLLAAFGGLYVLNLLVSKWRWNRLVAGLHLYSSKIMGYLQGIFLVVLFAYGFWKPLFYGALIWGLLSETEYLLINLTSRAPVHNAKGLYWAWKEGRLQ